MTAMKTNLIALLLCALMFGAPMAHHVWAVPCNSQTPTLGNCGTESQCEVRAGIDCIATFGKYYFTTQGGIACQSGGSDSYCAQVTAAGGELKCTCEWLCKWDPMAGTCGKGAGHEIAGQQICSTMKEYRSKSCTIGGGH